MISIIFLAHSSSTYSSCVLCRHTETMFNWLCFLLVRALAHSTHLAMIIEYLICVRHCGMFSPWQDQAWLRAPPAYDSFCSFSAFPSPTLTPASDSCLCHFCWISLPASLWLSSSKQKHLRALESLLSQG